MVPRTGGLDEQFDTQDSIDLRELRCDSRSQARSLLGNRSDI